jgi:hypothetical protein
LLARPQLLLQLLPVFYHIKFTTADPYIDRGPEDSIINSIHVQPSKTLKNGELLPAQFDTVLINDGTSGIMVETPGLAASKSGHGGSGQEVGW